MRLPDFVPQIADHIRGEVRNRPLVDVPILDEFRLAKAPQPMEARQTLGSDANALFLRLLKDGQP